MGNSASVDGNFFNAWEDAISSIEVYREEAKKHTKKKKSPSSVDFVLFLKELQLELSKEPCFKELVPVSGHGRLRILNAKQKNEQLAPRVEISACGSRDLRIELYSYHIEGVVRIHQESLECSCSEGTKFCIELIRRMMAI